MGRAVWGQRRAAEQQVRCATTRAAPGERRHASPCHCLQAPRHAVYSCLSYYLLLTAPYRAISRSGLSHHLSGREMAGGMLKFCSLEVCDSTRTAYAVATPRRGVPLRTRHMRAACMRSTSARHALAAHPTAELRRPILLVGARQPQAGPIQAVRGPRGHHRCGQHMANWWRAHSGSQQRASAWRPRGRCCAAL